MKKIYSITINLTLVLLLKLPIIQYVLKCLESMLIFINVYE